MSELSRIADLMEEFRDYAARQITRGGAHHDQDYIWARVSMAIDQLRAPSPDRYREALEIAENALGRVVDGLDALTDAGMVAYGTYGYVIEAHKSARAALNGDKE